MLICSIDIGIGGAIAVIHKQTPLRFHDMPTQKVGSKTLVCPDKLAAILQKENPGVVVAEQVGASPLQGVSSSFNFGFSFGIVQGVCAGLMIPCYTMTPQKWKTYHGLTGKPKDAARLKALLLYPHLSKELKRKKDVDRADAALMGTAWAVVYMREKLEG